MTDGPDRYKAGKSKSLEPQASTDPRSFHSKNLIKGGSGTRERHGAAVVLWSIKQGGYLYIYLDLTIFYIGSTSN